MSLGPLGPDEKRRSSGLTFRIDRSQIRENTDGSIEVPAQLTRTGVFTYQRGDQKVRELRSEDEVFNQDALDSLQGSYLTKDHPPEFLTADNWKDYAKGVVSHVTVNPPFVEGRLRVWDSDVRHMVEKGYLTEVSCGYACIPKEVTDSDEADVVQSQIRYNHAAIGPQGWSRLGTVLRLDSKDNEVLEHFKEDQNMEELKEALEPVLAAIKGLEEKYDSLSQTLEASVKADEEKTEDSPVQKYEDLPNAEKVAAMVKERVDSALSLELKARDAYEEIFGWRFDDRSGHWVREETYHVDAVPCGRKLCEDVLRTVDEDRIIKDDEELGPLVREAINLGKRARLDRMASRPTLDSLKSQLSGVPAHVLQTPKSPIDDFFGTKKDN